MCVSLTYPIPVTKEEFEALPGLHLKRSERFSSLRGFTLKRTGLARAMLTNQTVGLVLRVPDGELWKPVEMQLKLGVTGATGVGQANVFLANDLPVNLNGKWDGSKEAYQRTFGSFSSAAGPASSFTFTWTRDGTDIRYRQIDEAQCFYTYAKWSGNTQLDSIQFDMIYYRVPTWDTVLAELREDYDECEIVKLMSAMGVSVYPAGGCDAGSW